jgi:S-adenosylmethionine hydrolase
MPRRIITLTTDFGGADHFVGTMKGVILSIQPGAQIVDISHEVTAFEIPEAAFLLSQAYPYFPKKTIHVVVVDPGVGTARRPILVEAAGQYFIAPDNGVLSMVYSRERHKVRHITARKYWLREVSNTFHGRDIFAPAAAHLARGTPPAQFGKLITDYLRQNFEKPVRTGKRFWTGAVLKADHFGNLITNFHINDFPELTRRPFEMSVGIRRVCGLASSYAECSLGELALIVGSSGYVEVAINQGSAAKALGCGSGAPVELTLY